MLEQTFCHIEGVGEKAGKRVRRNGGWFFSVENHRAFQYRMVR